LNVIIFSLLWENSELKCNFFFFGETKNWNINLFLFFGKIQNWSVTSFSSFKKFRIDQELFLFFWKIRNRTIAFFFSLRKFRIKVELFLFSGKNSESKHNCFSFLCKNLEHNLNFFFSSLRKLGSEL
jgi:hypothetical protein